MPDNLDSQLEQANTLFQQGKHVQATNICHTLCNTHEEDGRAWCLLSAIYGSQGQLAAAAKYAEKAIKLSPKYLMAYTNLGTARFHLKQYHLAADAFTRATRIQPYNWTTHFQLGMCYENIPGRDDDAIASYEKAVNNTQKPSREPVVKLALAYERNGQLNKANQLIDHYLQSVPLDPEVGLIRARNDASSGKLEQAAKYLKVLLEQPGLNAWQRARLLNEQGLSLDKLKHYDMAYEAFSECQGIEQSLNSQFNGQVIFEKIKANQEASTQESTARWLEQEISDDLAAPIFLVGFPRSGTTLTERILSSHSSVVPSSEENIVPKVIDRMNEMTPLNINYPENLDGLSITQVTQLRQYYIELAQNSCGSLSPDQCFLDKLPLNLIELSFIFRIFPEAKIILVIRDPRDVCLSCFMQQFTANHAMANFYTLENAAKFYDATMNLMEHYRSVMKLNLYVSKYEDLVADIEKQARGMLEFLELEWDEAVLDYRNNRKYKILTPSYFDTNKPIFSSAIGRWKNYTSQMQAVADILQPHVSRYGYES